MNTTDLVKQLLDECCCSQIEGCGKCVNCRAADALDNLARVTWSDRPPSKWAGPIPEPKEPIE